MIPYWFLIIKGFIEDSLKTDETGQTLVEYALIIALIAIAVIGAIIILRGGLGDIFDHIGNNIPVV